MMAHTAKPGAFLMTAPLLLSLLMPLASCVASTRDKQSDSLPDSTLRAKLTANGVQVEKCSASVCESVVVPARLAEKVQEGREIFVDDVDEDGYSELVVTGRGDVNNCSDMYELSNNSKLVEVKFSYPLCNYTVVDGHIVSSYRDGAMWHEDVYRRGEDGYVLLARDRCVGCGEVFRDVFEGDAVPQKMVVSDEASFFDRKQLVTVVRVERAQMYNSPSLADDAAMYLVQGDVVHLVDYSDSGDGWYQLQYNTAKKPIIKWVRCSDLAVCGQ